MVIGATVLRGESVGCRSGFQHCLLEAHSLRSLAVIGDGLVPVGVEQVIDLAGVLVGRARFVGKQDGRPVDQSPGQMKIKNYISYIDRRTSCL